MTPNKHTLEHAAGQRPATAGRRVRSYRAPARLRRTARGYAGTGGGRWGIMPAPAVHIGSSVQVCGLWPFPVGAPRPAVGVPLGTDMDSTSHVCCDPINWFRLGLLSVPSAFIYGLPGHGKSSLAARWIIGLADQGTPSLVLGDIKPDYRELIGTPEADGGLGGIVLSVGPGAGTFNPLDLGALRDVAERVGGKTGTELLELARSKAVDLLIVLATITRGKPLQDFEETILAVAIALAYERERRPSLRTLVDVIESAHPSLVYAAVSDGSSGYQKDTRKLLRTLRAMLEGPMGDVFGADTTTAFPLDTPGGVCVDISALNKAPKKLLAAVLVATWTHGFLSVDAHWELARAGLTEWRGFFVVLDELWKAMGVAPGLVELIDQLTRTNRAEGVGDVKISHSPKDPKALPSKADRITAAGFAERAGMVALFGLSRRDLQALNGTSVELSQNEIDTVSSWRNPRSMRSRRRQTGKPLPPPGAGKVLLKLGGAPGIATQIILTEAEHQLHDTNQRW